MFSKLLDALRSKTSSGTTTPSTSQPASRNASQPASRNTSRPASRNASRPASASGGGPGSPTAAAAVPFSVPRHESRNNFPGTNAASYGANNFGGMNPRGSRNPFPGDN